MPSDDNQAARLLAGFAFVASTLIIGLSTPRPTRRVDGHAATGGAEQIQHMSIPSAKPVSQGASATSSGNEPSSSSARTQVEVASAARSSAFDADASQQAPPPTQTPMSSNRPPAIRTSKPTFTGHPESSSTTNTPSAAHGHQHHPYSGHPPSSARSHTGCEGNLHGPMYGPPPPTSSVVPLSARSLSSSSSSASSSSTVEDYELLVHNISHTDIVLSLTSTPDAPWSEEGIQVTIPLSTYLSAHEHVEHDNEMNPGPLSEIDPSTSQQPQELEQQDDIFARPKFNSFFAITRMIREAVLAEAAERELLGEGAGAATSPIFPSTYIQSQTNTNANIQSQSPRPSQLPSGIHLLPSDGPLGPSSSSSSNHHPHHHTTSTASYYQESQLNHRSSFTLSPVFSPQTSKSTGLNVIAPDQVTRYSTYARRSAKGRYRLDATPQMKIPVGFRLNKPVRVDDLSHLRFRRDDKAR